MRKRNISPQNTSDRDGSTGKKSTTDKNEKTEPKPKSNYKDQGGTIDAEPENIKIGKKDKGATDKNNTRNDPGNRDRQHELNHNEEMAADKQKQRKPRPEKLDPFRQKIYNEMSKMQGSETKQQDEDEPSKPAKPDRRRSDPHEPENHVDSRVAPISDRRRSEAHEPEQHLDSRVAPTPDRRKSQMPGSYRNKEEEEEGDIEEDRDLDRYHDPRHSASPARDSHRDESFDHADYKNHKDNKNDKDHKDQNPHKPATDNADKPKRRQSEMPGPHAREGKIDFSEEGSKKKKPETGGKQHDRRPEDRHREEAIREEYEQDDPRAQQSDEELEDEERFDEQAREPAKPYDGKSKVSDRRFSEMPGAKGKPADRRYSNMPKDGGDRKPLVRPKEDKAKHGALDKAQEKDRSDEEKDNHGGYHDHNESEEETRKPIAVEQKSILKKKEPGQSREREDSKSKGVMFREDVKHEHGPSQGTDQTTKQRKSVKIQPKEEGGEIDESEVVGINKKPKDGATDGSKRHPKINVTTVDHNEKGEIPQRRQSTADKNKLITPVQDHISDVSDEGEEYIPGRDIVNIPVKTYSRMRNLKALSQNLDEDLKERDYEDPENLEVIEEQAHKVTDLGESVMKDLVENNPNNQFIQKLDEEFQDIVEEVNKEDQTEEEKQKSMEKLIKWQKKLKKLEVKEQTIKPDEKKQFRDMYKRPSFRALVNGDSPGKEEINSQKIQEGKIEDEYLQDYVRVFLGIYSEKMEAMDTPISRVFAKESNQTLSTLNVVQKEKASIQGNELIKLIATAICDKFQSEDQDLLSSMVNDEDLKDKKMVEFNHFLRAVNNLSAIPFKTLDDIITEPSTKINLFNIRKDKMTKFSDNEYKDKEADLLKLNSLEKDKRKIEELFINLGKEVLPPEPVKNTTHMYDSGMPDMDINFIPISSEKKKETAPAIVEPGYKKNFDSDDSFGQDIKFGGTNYEETAVQKRFSMVQPNLIDSENEFEESSEDPKEKSTPPPPESLRAGIDYREDLADKLELIIEGIGNTQSDTKMARQEIKKHHRSKTPMNDSEKIEIFDQLSKALEETNELTKEGDEFKGPYEQLKRDIIEKLQIASNHLPPEHNRGLIKMWSKYNRQLKKLKDETVALLTEIQSSPTMQANEPQTAEELEIVKEQLEEFQKVLLDDSKTEENDPSNKQPIDHNHHLIIEAQEVEKEIKEQDKKHKEMDRQVESLTGKIENLRRASLMHPHLDPQNKKNHRFSTITNNSGSNKPKDKKSILHALIQDQREEEKSEDELKLPQKIEEEESGEEDQDLQIEKDLQKLKSQSVAALTSLNTDEESDEALNRLDRTLADPKMAKLVEMAGGEEEAADLRKAIEDKDEEAIKPKIKALYQKIAQAQITPEQAKEVEMAGKAQEDESLDEDAKMDVEIQKRREAKIRAEKEVKNIKDIVEQLKEELNELKNRSEGLETVEKRQPTKLKHVKKNIDECQNHLNQTPMPAPTCVSQIKQTTRDADHLLPKNEELTPEIIADIDEFEALTKQINKNVDQLSVNMTDVAEFRLKGSADYLVDIGKDKGIDLKAPTKDGSAPENSEKLTNDDRQELQKALDKVKQDSDNANKMVEEWVFAKAEEIGHLVDAIKAKETKNSQLGRVADSVAKVVQALNLKKQPQAVPRSVLELAKANDAFQQTEVKNSLIDPSKTSDPVSTNQLAKAVVDIEDAAERFQDITDLMLQLVNNVIANTTKAIACHDKGKEQTPGFTEDKAKRRNSARKHEGSREDMKAGGGDDDSVEKYYYSEFTEGSLAGRQDLEPKTHHNRKQDFSKGLPREDKEDKDNRSGFKSEDKQEPEAKRPGKDLKHRKSQLKQLEEKLMREQDDEKERPERYKTLKDEADQDKQYRSLDKQRQAAKDEEGHSTPEQEHEHDSDDVEHLMHDSEDVRVDKKRPGDRVVEDRRKSRIGEKEAKFVEENQGRDIPRKEDDRKNAIADDRKNALADDRITDNTHKRPSRRILDDEPDTRKPLDEDNYHNFNYQPNKSKGKNEDDSQDKFSNEKDKSVSEDEVSHDEEDKNENNPPKTENDRRKSHISEYKDGKGKAESSELIETASRRKSKYSGDNKDKNLEPEERYEYTETANKKFNNKYSDDNKNKSPEDRYEYTETANKKFNSKSNDHDSLKAPSEQTNPRRASKISKEKIPKELEKNKSESSSKRHSEASEKYNTEEGEHNEESEFNPKTSTENLSRKSLKIPDKPKEIIETATRRYSNRPQDKEDDYLDIRNQKSPKDKDPVNREELLETASMRANKGPDSKETLEAAYRRKSRGPENHDDMGTTTLETFDYLQKDKSKAPENKLNDQEEVRKEVKPQNQSGTQGSPNSRKSIVKHGKLEEGQPIERVVREGEIIVAELEEGKTGASKIRFSVVDPKGRKSVIDNRHMINPQTEFGEELYRSITSSKRSAEFASNPRKPADPIASAMEARKSIVRDRLVLPLLEDEEGSQKFSSVPEAPANKKLLILDGRPRDPEMIGIEKVVFPKEAISRTIHSQQNPSKSQAVERINPKISDPNADTNSPEGMNNQTEPANFIPPIDRPKNFEEKRKTYFIEDEEKIGADLVPCLVELDYMYFKNNDEPKSDSEEEKLHPLDPFESFYQECDQSKKSVPKISNTKVFKRKVRKLTPEEQRASEQEKLEIAKLLRNPALVPCETLDKTQEWANGRPVYKKQIEFIQTKNNLEKEPAYQESKLEYYQLIEKNPDFTDSIMYPEQAVIRSYNPKPPETNLNTFDSLNRSELLSPVKFLLGQGPDGTIRIYQLESYEGNPLIETEAGRLSLPTNIEESQEGFKTMYRHSGNFNDSPVLEPQTSQVLDFSALGVPTHRHSEIQQLADRRVLTPEELARFLEMVRFVPNVKIELYKQSPEEVKGKSIVEEGLHFNSMAYSDRASILKQIGDLQRQGKIVSGDQQAKPKITIEESIKLSALHSDDRIKQSFLQEPKINAIKLEDTYEDKPLYQIVDKKDDHDEDDEKEIYDPVSHLKEELEKLSTLSEAQVPFSDIANLALKTTDDVKNQKKVLKKLIDELEKVAKQKGQAIEDWMFMPNGTSMVNNSIKSEISYKNSDWMKLSEIYKVNSYNQAKYVPFEFQSKRAVPSWRKSYKIGGLYGCLMRLS